MLELGNQIGNVSKGLTTEQIMKTLKKCCFYKGKMDIDQEKF